MVSRSGLSRAAASGRSQPVASYWRSRRGGRSLAVGILAHTQLSQQQDDDDPYACALDDADEPPEQRGDQKHAQEATLSMVSQRLICRKSARHRRPSHAHRGSQTDQVSQPKQCRSQRYEGTHERSHCRSRTPYWSCQGPFRRDVLPLPSTYARWRCCPRFRLDYPEADVCDWLLMADMSLRRLTARPDEE